jgi:hypothetical protein
MQDAVEATARRLRLAAALILAAMAVSAATAPGASAAQVCGVTGPRICVDVVANNASVSPSAVTPTYASFTVIITNEAKNNVTHVTLRDAVGGGTFFSATPSVGTCTPSGQCTFGSLPSGGQVAVTIQAQTAAVDGTITNTATVSFDEGINDSPAADPKQDTVTNSASTPVQSVVGKADSLVPSNTEVQLDTDPTFNDKTSPADPNIGRAKIPATAHAAITASLEEVTAPAPCPKKEICRSGAWVHATVPGTFLTAPLEFTLHWNKTLVLKSQSTKNLNVLKTECLTGCPVVVISRRCTAASGPTPGNPCLTNIAEDANEFRATVLSSENGYMR